MNSSTSDYAVLKQQMSEEQISLFVRRLAQQEIEFEDFKAHFTQLVTLIVTGIDTIYELPKTKFKPLL